MRMYAAVAEDTTRCREHLRRRVEADRAIELRGDRRERVACAGAHVDERPRRLHQRIQSLEIPAARVPPTLRVGLGDSAELLARRDHEDILRLIRAPNSLCSLRIDRSEQTF